VPNHSRAAYGQFGIRAVEAGGAIQIRPSIRLLALGG